MRVEFAARVKLKAMPPQEYFCKLLRYQPATGLLYWLARPGNESFNMRDAGTVALTARTRGGYLHGHIDGKKYYAHRVIWKMVYGTDPDHIDHINHDRTDNRIENLRNVSQSDNNRNVRLSFKNSSGVIGITWDKARKKWAVQIKVGGKNKHLGRYHSFNEAKAVRKQAERDHGFHENHGAANAG